MWSTLHDPRHRFELYGGLEPNSQQHVLLLVSVPYLFPGETMLKTSLSRQLTNLLTPLSVGVALVASMGISVEARPVVIVQPPLPTTHIIGSPIPSPVPLVPGTTTPYSLSPYNYSNYNTVVVTPRRQVIQNSTLINPTIINSRISDSVLVDPVIINSQRYPIYQGGGSRFIYSSPGVRIRIGQ